MFTWQPANGRLFLMCFVFVFLFFVFCEELSKESKGQYKKRQCNLLQLKNFDRFSM